MFLIKIKICNFKKKIDKSYSQKKTNWVYNISSELSNINEIYAKHKIKK